MPHIIQKKVFIVCARGHIDQMPKPEDPRQAPGFSMALNLPNGLVRVTQLCRLCYHDFMAENFGAKVMPDDATEEEARVVMQAWKAEVEAERDAMMARATEAIRQAGERAGAEAAIADGEVVDG